MEVHSVGIGLPFPVMPLRKIQAIHNRQFHLIRDHKKQNALISLTWGLGQLQPSLQMYSDLFLAHS